MAQEHQPVYQRSPGYQLFLIGYTRDGEKQYCFVVALEPIEAYDLFRSAHLDIVPDKIQQVDLDGMGYFLLKRRDDWSDG